MSERIEAPGPGQLPESDLFRKLDSIDAPDPRMQAWASLDPRSGVRAMTIEDRWNNIAALILHDGVPATVRVHFETARNLLLYSWFVYRFQPVAEMHAYASVEYALKQWAKVPPKEFGPGLNALLTRAVAEGVIRDAGFRHYRKAAEYRAESARVAAELEGRDFEPEEPSDAQRYAKALCEAIPYLRNELAHGSPRLAPSGLRTLALCCDLINQLFPPSHGANGARKRGGDAHND
jgi:hypothetical protein